VGKAFEMFMENESKRVMLLLGEAGSGKSMFNEKMKQSILGENSQTHLTILIPISLPSLEDPLENLFVEAVKKTFNFSSAQAEKLAERKDVLFVLFLDSYDEMKSEFIGKRLFESNAYVLNAKKIKNNF